MLTTLSSTSIKVTWTDNSDNEDGFQIQWFKGEDHTYVSGVDAPPNTGEYTSTDLEPNTTYYFHVAAYRAPTVCEYTALDSATTLNEPPAAPASLTVGLNDGKDAAMLHWTDNSTTEDGFVIERALAQGAFEVLDTVAANVDTFY